MDLLSPAFNLWRIYFFDDRPKVVTHHKNGELFHFFELVPTCLSILELSSDICIAVFVKSSVISALTLFLIEYLYINLRKSLAFNISYFELSIFRKNVDFDLSRVISFEDLFTLASDLNHHVLVLKFFRDIQIIDLRLLEVADSVNRCVKVRSFHLLFDCVAWFNIRELTCAFFQEWSTREENLCINNVELNDDCSEIGNLKLDAFLFRINFYF